MFRFRERHNSVTIYQRHDLSALASMDFVVSFHNIFRNSELNAQNFEDIVTASFTTMGLPLRELREMEELNLSLANPNLSVAVVIY